MTILVTGSTGAIGTQVLTHLADHGAEVRALTRSPEKAKLPPGVVATQGDLSDVDSVRKAIDGVSTLFLLASNVADELSQAMQTVNVARAAGVRGLVYLSVFKADTYSDVPHFAAKYTVERMIEAADLPATVLRPAYFMQNDERQKDALLTHGVYGAPIGDRGVSMVDIRDIGDAAARELLRRERATAPLPRTTYALVGPDPLDGAALAALWSDVLGRAIRFGGNDLDVFEQRLGAVSPGGLAYDMRLMMQRYQDDGAAATPEELDRLTALLGRPPLRYRDFAEEAARGWMGS